ncbi:hypothetical protein E2C01_071635 [Portunus trituberculatus]|uniref:Uncharacterized protein n=1 Tax=Portunus trituberculatus TaxID=210409 RepID=A0A5B7I6Q9_PORTR|nr:hypothetical protein [Portunus trituberculatus]
MSHLNKPLQVRSQLLHMLPQPQPHVHCYLVIAAPPSVNFASHISNQFLSSKKNNINYRH